MRDEFKELDKVGKSKIWVNLFSLTQYSNFYRYKSLPRIVA